MVKFQVTIYLSYKLIISLSVNFKFLFLKRLTRQEMYKSVPLYFNMTCSF